MSKEGIELAKKHGKLSVGYTIELPSLNKKIKEVSLTSNPVIEGSDIIGVECSKNIYDINESFNQLLEINFFIDKEEKKIMSETKTEDNNNKTQENDNKTPEIDEKAKKKAILDQELSKMSNEDKNELILKMLNANTNLNSKVEEVYTKEVNEAKKRGWINNEDDEKNFKKMQKSENYEFYRKSLEAKELALEENRKILEAKFSEEKKKVELEKERLEKERLEEIKKKESNGIGKNFLDNFNIPKKEEKELTIENSIDIMSFLSDKIKTSSQYSTSEYNGMIDILIKKKN